jgi:serine/threonine-protein kinase
MIAGTPHYVAPEQVRGEQVTPRSDIYSLGVLAYVLYLGIAPFDADSSGEILDLQVKELPPPPRERWADIPPALEQLILKMLAKRPDERPTMPEVIRALRSLHRPVPPPPPPPRRVIAPAPLHDFSRDDTVASVSRSMIQSATREPRWWLGALVIAVLVAGSLVWRMGTNGGNQARAAVPPPPAAVITHPAVASPPALASPAPESAPLVCPGP